MSETAKLTKDVEGAEVPVAGTYTLDLAHTTVSFVARHLMVSKVRGNFAQFEGTVTVAEDVAASSVTASIKTASVDTGEPQRDAHLKSADFFDVETYPEMTFSSTGLRRDGSHWRLDGDLTIHGVTKPVSLDLEFNGATPDPWGGVRIGFSAATEIDREDFGMTFNMALETGGVLVSKRVKIEIEAQAIRQP